MFTGFKEDIDSFFARDPAARSRLEIVFCYPGFHAVCCYRMCHWLWGKGWKFLARFLAHIGRFFTGVEIHPGAVIGKRFFIDHGMGVVIGETSHIGDDVTIYHGATLGGTAFHDGIRHPQIEDHVVVGAGAQLLGPIAVGKAAKIGSNAVVVKDVKAGATMVGVPALAVKASKKKDDALEFSAYGTDGGVLPDPHQREIEKLVKEVQRLQERLDKVESKNSKKKEG